VGECFFWYQLTRVVPDKGLKMVVVFVVFISVSAVKKLPTGCYFDEILNLKVCGSYIHPICLSGPKLSCMSVFSTMPNFTVQLIITMQL